MLKSKQIWQFLFLVGLICLSSWDVGAQACGVSVTTVFAENAVGETVRDLKIKVKFLNHEFRATQIYWDDKIRAHVIHHGICLEHINDVVVKFSAKGYEPLTQTIDMPFVRRGYVVLLSRKNSGQRSSMTEVSCTEGTRQCAQR